MISDTVNPIISTFISSLSSYLPHLFGGLLIFIIGLILAEILKRILLSLLHLFKLKILLSKSGVASEKEVKIWEEIFAEILRWSLIILFLIPAAEVWGLTQITGVFNQLLFYLPNVLISVVIGFVGIIFSHLTSDLVKQSIKTIHPKSAVMFSAFARYAIIFFTVLIVMNQLGIAQDLIRILFTGIIAMLALAGGLAFGLGGKEVAKDLLDALRKKL